MELDAAKLMKPCIELNLGVWQGDCLLGIDQNRSKMFRKPGMQMLVLWRAESHCPDDRAEIPHPATSGSGSRGVGEMLLDAETRRRGETRGEHLFRIGFRACKATQESQPLRARRQRRSYGFAARLTLGWKADQRSARRIPQRGLVQ